MLFLRLLRWSYTLLLSFCYCGVSCWFICICWTIPCIPGISPIWSWCLVFLMCCLILFARLLLRILHLCSSGIFACHLRFLDCLCLVWILGWCWPRKISLEMFPLLPVFGKIWEGWVLILLWMFGRIHVGCPVWFRPCLYWDVFHYWVNLLICYWSIQGLHFFFFVQKCI